LPRLHPGPARTLDHQAAETDVFRAQHGAPVRRLPRRTSGRLPCHQPRDLVHAPTAHCRSVVTENVQDVASPAMRLRDTLPSISNLSKHFAICGCYMNTFRIVLSDKLFSFGRVLFLPVAPNPGDAAGFELRGRIVLCFCELHTCMTVLLRACSCEQRGNSRIRVLLLFSTQLLTHQNQSSATLLNCV